MDAWMVRGHVGEVRDMCEEFKEKGDGCLPGLTSFGLLEKHDSRKNCRALISSPHTKSPKSYFEFYLRLRPAIKSGG